jgi:hypothetical protein
MNAILTQFTGGHEPPVPQYTSRNLPRGGGLFGFSMPLVLPT